MAVQFRTGRVISGRTEDKCDLVLTDTPRHLSLNTAPHRALHRALIITPIHVSSHNI